MFPPLDQLPGNAPTGTSGTQTGQKGGLSVKIPWFHAGAYLAFQVHQTKGKCRHSAGRGGDAATVGKGIGGLYLEMVGPQKGQVGPDPAKKGLDLGLEILLGPALQ